MRTTTAARPRASLRQRLMLRVSKSARKREEALQYKRMEFSVYSHQKSMVPLLGLCDCSFTVGQAEFESFQETQFLAKKAGRPYFDPCPP